MKKTLLILCALLLTVVGASAQVTDVTEQYIKNASFETDAPTGDFTDSSHGAYTITSLTDWTLVVPTNSDVSTRAVADLMTVSATATDDNIGAPGAPSDGTYMLYLRNAWKEDKASVTQKVTLPAGDYMLTVDNKCFTTATSITSGEKVILKAGEKEVELSITQVTANSTATPSVVPEEWSVGIVEFSIDTDGTEIELGVAINFQNAAGLSVLLDNFKLYSIEYEYNITKLLANPSFEDDDPVEEGWTLDYSTTGTPRASEGTGAWTIPETGLTGWNINGSVSVKDIMSADAAATDNDFGAPGEPADGTYMLYLRDAWNNEESTVLQSIVLPAGDYKVTVNSKCASTVGSSATLVAGEASVALTINSAMPEDWDTAVLEFSLSETTELSLGVDINFISSSSSNGSFLLDNFQLFSTEDVKAINFDYDVTWALANPSFEVDKVAYLTEDATRSYTLDSTDDGYDESYTGGAYTIGNGLTGWTLGGSNAVSDLMTEACQRTDNNFGAPGTPTDGTQMLYLRANTTATGSVKQTITLPAGDYMLTVDSKCVSTGSSTAKLVAGEKNAALTIHTESSIPSAWDTASLVLSLDAATEVTVGVDISYSGNGSFLLDNFKLYSVEEITKTISWTMTDAGWGTMILPFATSIPDGLTLYADDAITVSDSELTVDEEKAAASIAANTPYLVKSNVEVEEIPTEGIPYAFTGTPTNTADTYTVGVLTGTLVDLAVAKGAAFATDGTMYLLQNQEEVDGVAFYPIVATESADATLDAYHCYLTIGSEDGEASPTKLSIVLPGAGETTAIVAVEGDVIADGAIYDLSGRRVAKAVKGVYIQNGKKVLVK